MTIDVRTVCAAVFVAGLAGCHASPAPTPPPPAAPVDTGVAVAPPPSTPDLSAPPMRVGTCGKQQQQAFSLGPAAKYAPPGASGALAIGFLNNDAPIDLLVGGVDDRGKPELGVMLGNGDGTFKAPIEYPLLAGGEVRSVALTDFDTDEDLDIVTAGGTGTPQIFLNNGDGTFGAPVALPAGPGALVSGRTVVVRVADIHGDAHPDVVSYAGGGFDVWHDTGHAQFVASVLPPVEHLEHGAGLALADFDHDGLTDIAVAGTEQGASTIAVIAGKKGGSFAAPARYLAGANGAAVAVVTGDFDGNGHTDIAALFTAPGDSGGAIAVLPGKGKGNTSFGAAVQVAVPAAGDASTLFAADLNADGKTDLVVTTRRGLAIYMSGGPAGFAPAVLVPANDLRAVAAGDLRGDKLFGLAATRATGEATVWPASCR